MARSGWQRNPPFLALLAGAVIMLSFVGYRFFAPGEQESVSSSDGPHVSKDRDAKDDFIEQADALCAQATRKMTRVAVAPNSPELGRSIVKSIEINRNLLTQIRELEFPVENKGLLKRILTKVDESLEVARGFADAMIRGDRRAAKVAAKRTVELQNKANALGRRYGFDECSQS